MQYGCIYLKDVMSSLAEKLRLSCIDYFSLVLETSHGSRLNRFSLLANEQKLSEVFPSFFFAFLQFSACN